MAVDGELFFFARFTASTSQRDQTVAHQAFLLSNIMIVLEEKLNDC